MKKIKIFVMLLSIVLMICSCQKKDDFILELNEVYVCNFSHWDEYSGDVEYNEPKQTYQFQLHKSTVIEDPPRHQLRFGDDQLDLEYTYTYNKDYCEYMIHGYKNEEYNIRANYRADNGNLDYLRLGNYQYYISDLPIDSETSLLDVCIAYLNQYVSNIGSYSYTIETKIMDINENGSNNQSVEGYADSSIYKNAEVAYEVEFVYCIGGMPTTDIVKIRLGVQGNLELVSLNMIGEFRRFSECDIDMEKYEQLITTEMLSLCDIKAYRYIGYSDKKFLIHANDQLCLLSYATPIYEGLEKENNFTPTAIQLLIPISEQVN